MDLTELKRTINLCKESISTTTQDLTKLTGRNYDKPPEINRQLSNTSSSFRDNYNNNTKFASKRRNSYENENPNDIKKSRIDKEAPSLNSVVQMTRGRTRNDAIHDLKTLENPKEKERCKRLFGHLMGTLNSIKKEAEKSSNDPQQLTRMKIEKKVEEDHKLISETIQREQNELIRAKRDMQNDLKTLNQRYRAAEAFERWRVEKEKMKGYIRTTKVPFIFYKPKIINDETRLRIDQTAREIENLIEARKRKLESEIERVVKKHTDSNCNRQSDGLELADTKIDDAFRDSGASLGLSNLRRKERSKSMAHSFASEDYDDMIEEIEITMHDEPVAVHDGEERRHNDGVDVTGIDEDVVDGSEVKMDCGDEGLDQEFIEAVVRDIGESNDNIGNANGDIASDNDIGGDNDNTVTENDIGDANGNSVSENNIVDANGNIPDEIGETDENITAEMEPSNIDKEITKDEISNDPESSLN